MKKQKNLVNRFTCFKFSNILLGQLVSITSAKFEEIRENRNIVTAVLKIAIFVILLCGLKTIGR